MSVSRTDAFTSPDQAQIVNGQPSDDIVEEDAMKFLRSRDRLMNDHLNVDDFEVHVPKTCQIPNYGVVDDSFDWGRYFAQMSTAGKLGPPGACEAYRIKERDEYCALEGKTALRHALIIHRLFATEFLKLPGVSGVDVGFAVDETRREFENLLALRIHVSQKRSPTLLSKKGLPDLTSLEYLLVDLAGQLARDPEGFKAPKNWHTLARYFPTLPPRHPNPDQENYSLENFLVALRHLSKEPRLSHYRYPILGVAFGDLSCFVAETNPGTLQPRKHDLRLTLCGIPLDVLGAEYRPNALRGNRGVFVGDRGTTIELDDSEQLRTGRGRVDPLVGGVSIGGATKLTGTMGAVVWDRTDGAPCMLGNWHVLAGDPTAVQGQPCHQPAPFDGGNGGDVVAHLKRWHFGADGDVALAELNGSRSYVSGEILGMWRPLAGTYAPHLNLKIRKWGRTSGYTEGFIDGIQMTVDIRYRGGITRRFHDQFHIAPVKLGQAVSQPGDSGALVMMSYSPAILDNKIATYEAALGALLNEGGRRSQYDEHNRLTRRLGKIREEAKQIEGSRQRRDFFQKKLQKLVKRTKQEIQGPLTTQNGNALKRNIAALTENIDPEDRLPTEATTRDLLFKEVEASKRSLKRRLQKGYREAMAELEGVRVDREKRFSVDWSQLIQAASGQDLSTDGDPADFLASLRKCIEDDDLKVKLVRQLDSIGLGVTEALAKKDEAEEKQSLRTYLAVGLLFAGDTPGSPLGEFAIASSIQTLEETLDFSLRPVFAPRSSFRQVQTDGQNINASLRQASGVGQGTAPTDLGGDPRGGAPQPDSEKTGTGGDT